MVKLRILLTVLLLLIFSAQSEAKEVKPLFGFYKIVSNETDELLIQKWAELYMSDEAAQIYPKLYEAINKYTIEEHKKTMARQRQYHEEALTFKQEMPAIFKRPFYDCSDILIRRADTVVLSLLEKNANYTGGVHGMYGYFGVNFDTKTGNRLHISDVCRNADKLLNAIMMRLREDAPQSPFEDAESKIMKMIVEDTLNFTIEPTGITFYFNPYEIGSYAEGLFTATLLFSEYPNLFKSKYKKVPKIYCQTLTTDYHSNIVSLADGIRNHLQITFDDKGYYKILCDGNVAQDGTGLKDIKSPVLVHMADGKNYLYVDGYLEDRGRRLHVYAVSDNDIKLVHVLPYTFKNIGGQKYETWWMWTNPDNIRFDSIEDVNGITSHFGGISIDGSLVFG